jgi:threonine aldolase
MVDRLAEDHARAKALAAGLSEFKDLSIPMPHTNIVRFHLASSSNAKPEEIIAALAKDGVLVDYGRYEGFRACTHYWIDDAAIEKTLLAFGKVFKD